ncbi:MAG: hypothetical protein EOP56_07800 [Sphingobacteriales bacterium]|nr:MAG: hypothetical protein EOP56_07800 [Sphingobacteriales bacterium]
MEKTRRLGTTIVGSDNKAVIGRHCMRDMVFYSIELVADAEADVYYFMTYDSQVGKYRFVPGPVPVPSEVAGRADEFSAYISDSFHSHCMN